MSVLYCEHLVEKLTAFTTTPVSQRKYTPLHMAVIEGRHESMLELLLREAGLAEARDASGWTALHVAVSSGDVEAAGILLRHGAEPNARSFLGCTPMMLAILAKSARMAELLVGFGCDVNGVLVYDNGRIAPAVSSYLHCAIVANVVEIIEILLRSGADANRRDGDGLTPLHAAVGRGQLHAAQLLLQHGADLGARSWAGESPLELALRHFREPSRRRERRVLGLLLAFGADLLGEELREHPNARFAIKRRLAGLGPADAAAEPEALAEAFAERCREELARMQAWTLGGRGTLLDFLRADRRAAAALVGDAPVARRLEAALASRQFGIYEDLLERNLVLGKRYARILGRTFDSLNAACRYRLPSLALEEIMRHLNERDMRNVIEAQSGPRHA